MKLDQTRYKAFLDNPERYRLAFELNLAPEGLPYGIARGQVMHQYLDGWARGKSEQDILVGLEGISGEPLIKGKAMAQALQEHYKESGIEILTDEHGPISEREFEYQIPDSPHSLVGKIDHIIRHEGEVKVGDYKSCNAKKRYADLEAQWKTDVQADFYLIAARTFQLNPDKFLVRYVRELTPIDASWRIECERTSSRLDATLRSVHIVCELIQFMRATFGIEQPWPHTNTFPCNPGMREKWCEFTNICGCVIDPDWNLPGFTTRQEHLDICKETK